MKFDQLPNEILIDCFEYLNAIDIFYSFDQLNYRFHTLIRNISLHLNLHQMNKSLFDKFCHEMLLNPQVKSQIISLQLSNKNISDQLNVFLSFFSLNEFIQLRSLTLIDLDYNKFAETKSILLLLSDFCHGYFNDLMIRTCEILSGLSPSKIQMTSTIIHKTMTITSLTIYECNPNNLCQLFKYARLLKYLCIQRFSNSLFMNDKLDIINVYAVYLKELVLDNSDVSFEILKLLLKQTPNLKILTTTSEDRLDIIDAERWEELISSSLHQLDIFNFKFGITIDGNHNDILNKFQQYQTDFWHKQHCWYTIYEFFLYAAVIYTIPYVWNKYTLSSDAKRSDISSINNSKLFENVTNVSLIITLVDQKSEIYFENVKSLFLMEDSDLDYNLKPNTERYLESLQMVVNLSNLKHLDIEYASNIVSSNTLLQILKQAPQLSSLVIHKPDLISFFTNNELCQYLNKMINILDIVTFSDDKLITSDELNKLCQIFSNVEQLQCCIDETDAFLLILNHLPKLKNLKVDFYTFSTDTCTLLKLIASKLNIKCILHGKLG